MSRGFTPAAEAALRAADVSPIILFEGEFASGTVRLFSGTGILTWNGEEWAGGGTLLGISAISETQDVVATGASLALSGVPIELVAVAIEEAVQGSPGRLWIGLLDETGTVIPEPHQVYAGRLDVPTVSDNGETCTISISYEGRLVDLNRAREFRYTDESQQILHPEDAFGSRDRGFEFVTTIQDKEIVF